MSRRPHHVRRPHADTTTSIDGDAAVPPDSAFTALVDLISCLERVVAELTAAIERAHQIVALRETGQTWSEIARAEQRPLIVERVSRAHAELGSDGAQFRREQARALISENVPAADIAALFGVTRQRVAVLLRTEPSSVITPPTRDGGSE